MDRILKVYSSSGHLFAEFDFRYDNKQDAAVHYTIYRPLRDDFDDGSKSVYPSYDEDVQLPFRKFASISEIKTYDKDVVKKEVGHDMKDPKGYTYVYDEQEVLHRYIVENHRGCIGMVNILFSFQNNTKDVKFLSATNPRYDQHISSNSLETNVECITRIQVYQDREEPREISIQDVRKLPAWY